MNSKTIYSIVVPVFRSEKSLVSLYERISKTFSNIDGDYELIFIEDCGGDNSWAVMKSLRKKDKKVRIIKLMRNFGQHNALMCGFNYALGDYIITMDDDLQNPPEEIPKLIKAIKENDSDAVFGVPIEKKHSLYKKMGSFLLAKFVAFLFKQDPKFRLTNFRIIRKDIINIIIKDETPNPTVGMLILNTTSNIANTEVIHAERLSGNTNYTISKLVKNFLNTVLYNSAIPLHFIFLLGILSICVSFVLSVYFLAIFLLGEITVPGWITLVLLFLFFSGIVMFSIGIIGEYLLRITQEMRRNPQYVIRKKDI